MSAQEHNDQLTVRLARETDLDDVEEMVNDFVKGHPAEKHPRSRSVLCAAYFGDAPVARLGCGNPEWARHRYGTMDADLRHVLGHVWCQRGVALRAAGISGTWSRCCDCGGNLCPSTPSWGEFIRGGGDDE